MLSEDFSNETYYSGGTGSGQKISSIGRSGGPVIRSSGGSFGGGGRGGGGGGSRPWRRPGGGWYGGWYGGGYPYPYYYYNRYPYFYDPYYDNIPVVVNVEPTPETQKITTDDVKKVATEVAKTISQEVVKDMPKTPEPIITNKIFMIGLITVLVLILVVIYNSRK